MAPERALAPRRADPSAARTMPPSSLASFAPPVSAPSRSSPPAPIFRRLQKLPPKLSAQTTVPPQTPVEHPVAALASVLQVAAQIPVRESPPPHQSTPPSSASKTAAVTSPSVPQFLINSKQPVRRAPPYITFPPRSPHRRSIKFSTP